MNKTNMLGIAALLLLPVAGAVGQVHESALSTALKSSYEAEAQQDYKASIKALVVHEAAGSYIAQLRLGWLGYCSGDWSESISHYKQAVQLAPFAVEPLLGQMISQQAAGSNDDAIRTAQAVLRLDPANYTAISRTAWMLYLKRDFKQAASAYRKLVSLYPTDTEMLLGLGFSLKSAGEKNASVPYFRTVLLLSPNNARALAGLDLEADIDEVRKTGTDNLGVDRGSRPGLRRNPTSDDK